MNITLSQSYEEPPIDVNAINVNLSRLCIKKVAIQVFKIPPSAPLRQDCIEWKNPKSENRNSEVRKMVEKRKFGASRRRIY